MTKGKNIKLNHIESQIYRIPSYRKQLRFFRYHFIDIYVAE